MVGYSLGLKICNFIIIIIIYICLSTTSSADVYHYGDCSSTWSCGNVTNISYPFLWEGRPNYCGHPHLKLMCPPNRKDDYPILQITDAYDGGDVSFQVLGISNVSKPIKLRLDPSYFHYQNYSSCPTHFPNTYLFNKNRHKLTDLFLDIFFLNVDTSVICVSYNCSDPYHQDCQFFDIPTPNEELNKLQQRKAALENVLEQGFEVVMNKDKYPCIRCRNSGGVCGSSETSLFVCYCNDKTSLTECSKRKGSLGGGMLMLVGLVFLCRNMRHTRKFVFSSRGKGAQHQNIEAFLKIYGSLAPKRYTYGNIKQMTNNYKDKLGEGGYATVYKGKLQNGRIVAVKLLKQVKDNGEDFINEVASIGRTNHVNIVSLLGFCFEGKKRALIYEFMSNGSLERFTYRGAGYKLLSLETLFNIVLGIAKGLDYLHQGCNARILHFDIKPHNILLDEEFHPKISDFGLARLCSQQESSISMLEARGTIGYIAPEVFCRSIGGVSHKSDVYSYGMMVLDLLCGRTNVGTDIHHSSELYFPQWIYNQLELGEEFMSHGVLNEEENELQRKMILVGLWCIQTYPSNRPSMHRVTEMLNGNLESILMPPKPFISSPPRLVSYTLETSTTI